MKNKDVVWFINCWMVGVVCILLFLIGLVLFKSYVMNPIEVVKVFGVVLFVLSCVFIPYFIGELCLLLRWVLE